MGWSSFSEGWGLFEPLGQARGNCCFVFFRLVNPWIAQAIKVFMISVCCTAGTVAGSDDHVCNGTVNTCVLWVGYIWIQILAND